jgi:hypothetical protein
VSADPERRGHTGSVRTISVIVVALALVFVGAGSGAAPTSSAGRPALRLVRPAPLELRATGFRSGELVRLRVLAPKPASRRASANAAGAFSASFPAVSIDRCSVLAIVAVGARGSRASLKRPAVYCPPRL